MTTTTRLLADQAKAIMQGSDGLRKAAARCVAVVCGSSPSVEVARAELEHITTPDLREASIGLLAQLAAGVTGPVKGGS